MEEAVASRPEAKKIRALFAFAYKFACQMPVVICFSFRRSVRLPKLISLFSDQALVLNVGLIFICRFVSHSCQSIRLTRPASTHRARGRPTRSTLDLPVPYVRESAQPTRVAMQRPDRSACREPSRA